jgi:hypothetical protein
MMFVGTVDRVEWHWTEFGKEGLMIFTKLLRGFCCARTVQACFMSLETVLEYGDLLDLLQHQATGTFERSAFGFSVSIKHY